MERENETITELKCPNCGSNAVGVEIKHGIWATRCYNCGKIISIPYEIGKKQKFLEKK